MLITCYLVEANSSMKSFQIFSLHLWKDPDFYGLQLILDPTMPAATRSSAGQPDEDSDAEAAEEAHSGTIINICMFVST